MSLLRRSRSGRPSVVNEKSRTLILELYWKRNLGVRKIADYVGLSKMTVWREIQRNGIPEEISERLAVLIPSQLKKVDSIYTEPIRLNTGSQIGKTKSVLYIG